MERSDVFTRALAVAGTATVCGAGVALAAHGSRCACLRVAMGGE
jgi:hypothetical protein